MFLFLGGFLFAQTDSTRSTPVPEFQIHLDRPAMEIKHIMYDKNFLPIQGRLSEDKKSVVIKNYQKGNKVRVKVVYPDGSTEEIIRSPCFIDPYVL
ncbi:MAG: hypothetical protein IT242_06950 [Bacteroidia bacterium]|nr:hypothetical protein [Bacteroidia bacterium]